MTDHVTGAFSYSGARTPAGVLVSHQPALGRISFIEWLRENGPSLGRTYLNEVDRHFMTTEPSTHA